MPFLRQLGAQRISMPFQQKASAEAQKQAKFKPEPHKNNVINNDVFSDKFELMDELPEIQEFMDSMNMEVREQDLPKTIVKHSTNAFPTTGLILEISVTIIVSSESDVKSILLNKLLKDTGCTRTIIKQNNLPDNCFESRKQLKCRKMCN
jgi:hypothetical protein